MTIDIEALTIDTVIGILDFERTLKQTVIVETKINYNYTKESFIDYSYIIKKIETLLKKREYGLLEEAVDDIGSSIISDYPQINSLYLRISKPNIIKNATVSVSKEWK
jgi:dihydroneopterin aldolase